MAEERKGLSGWWAGLRGKTTEVVGNQQAAFARGKIAGVTVTDDAGNTLVEAGHRIDDAILARAQQAGKVAALAAAAMQGQAQDVREKVQTQYAKTENAKEARLLESVEDFQEAHRYLGRILTLDVTDIRGNIVVPAGKKLDADDVQRAREAGQLSALLFAAETSLPPGPESNMTPAPPSTIPAPRKPPTLLNVPDEEQEETP